MDYSLGMVNGHDYYGQQIDAIRSILQPVFRRFQLIGYAYDFLRCLYIDCFTSCTCIQGNYGCCMHVMNRLHEM